MSSTGGAAIGVKELIVYKRKRSKMSRNKEASSKGAVAKAEFERAKTVHATKNYQRYRENDNDIEVSKALTVVPGAGQPWQFLQDPKKNGWGTFRVGTSGYVYGHWKKIVYPEEAPQKQWFNLYSRLFDTVEINNTFYRLPAPAVFERWRSQAPSGFCYALKFSRYGTHMKRLKDPERPIALFLENAGRLGQALFGPILVQLPPRFDLHMERLREFLQRAPKQYRWAVEVRDSRWLCNEVYSVLHDHNASLCIHDHEDIPFSHPKVITANWVYLRFHGHNYQKCYKFEQLQEHASWIRKQLESGMDVYAYFNNDYSGFAAFNALELRKLVMEGS